MRAVLVALLVIATAACGSYRFPGQNPPGTGTVSGGVTAVPCAPVVSAGQPCAARPLSGLEIDFSRDASTIAARTDPRGDYAIELDAGTWKVSFKSYLRILSGPPTVTVTAGANSVANYVVDSGIRIPVSKEPSTNPHPPEGVAPA